MTSGGRLGGQDAGHGRAGNAGSSPARPTKRQRAMLWARLRKLDRAIGAHDKRAWMERIMRPDDVAERRAERRELDRQRWLTRIAIKWWWGP